MKEEKRSERVYKKAEHLLFKGVQEEKTIFLCVYMCVYITTAGVNHYQS